jgi:hypothetical protein
MEPIIFLDYANVLRSLQANLPWTVPYSNAVKHSDDPVVLQKHALLHLVKAMGRLSSHYEKVDHSKAPLFDDDVKVEVANLVIGALRLANLEGFDLQDYVLKQLEEKNHVHFRCQVLDVAESSPYLT